ncbi:helix-turn-helix domain containing protein [Thermoflavimicrobium daqui]|jgi:hypothetical protein|uniref:Helix-turn-helix domain containing protein n=1 Tax=Thermoflavimicrobium daqui TaxID=2137476 RepID=A0A364K0P8_9BACL|nr:helix-turn-helix domain containing protein [Thermoflavimicrobium daqui]RAL20838.1 helix-turn-helix domain containing protein [Thermoflavimicrobium daqui]
MSGFGNARMADGRKIKYQRQNIYTALEDLNFHWDEKEVLQFDQMWQKGVNLWDISRFFNRHIDEVAILAIDRARSGAIQPRQGGAFGQKRWRYKG